MTSPVVIDMHAFSKKIKQTVRGNLLQNSTTTAFCGEFVQDWIGPGPPGRRPTCHPTGLGPCTGPETRTPNSNRREVSSKEGRLPAVEARAPAFFIVVTWAAS